MKRLIGVLVSALLVGVLAGPVTAASHGRTVVAHINGGGTADMAGRELCPRDHPLGRRGHPLFRRHRLGGPPGHIDCVDQQGGTFPGNIFGEVTSWSGDLDGDPLP